MKSKKNLECLVKMARRTAEKEAGLICRVFYHQPKVPARLLQQNVKVKQ